MGKRVIFRVSQVQLQPIDPETGSPAAPPSLETGQPGESGNTDDTNQDQNSEAENESEEDSEEESETN